MGQRLSCCGKEEVDNSEGPNVPIPLDRVARDREPGANGHAGGPSSGDGHGRPIGHSGVGSNGSAHHNSRAEPAPAPRARSELTKRLRALDPKRRCNLPGPDEPLIHHGDPWTLERLQEERAAFWDTRTGVSNTEEETWHALRQVVENLQSGTQEGFEHAQALFNAAECTLAAPGSHLWPYVYGTRGERYDIKEWVVVQPKGLVEGPKASETSKTIIEESVEGDNKVPEDPGKKVAVKCRFSENGKDYNFKIGENQTVSWLAVKFVMAVGHTSPGKLRFLYMGRELDLSKTLSEQGWIPGYVITVGLSHERE